MINYNMDNIRTPKVVVDSEGLGTTLERALKEYNIKPDIIFIRDDGWTLGAPSQFERVAYRMWHDRWVAFIRKPNIEAQPMSEYQ